MTKDMLGANAGLVVAVVLWGAQVPLINFIADRYDPYFLAMLRFAGAAPLLLLALKLSERGPVLRGLNIGWIFALGAAVAAFGTLYTAGIAWSHPLTAAVLSAMSPITATLVAWAVLGSRPSRLLAFAILIVASGGVLSTVDFTQADMFGLRGGEPLILAGAACWSWFSIEAQRRLPGASQIRISALAVSAASFYLIIVYLVAGAAGLTRGSLTDATTADAGVFAMMIFGVAFLGIFLWNYGVARLGIVVASLYLNLIPLAALSVSLALGYHPRGEQLLGGAVVLAGVTLAQLGPRIFQSPPTSGISS